MKRSKQKFVIICFERYSYLCPNSWATVCATLSPLSWLTEQALSRSHIPPTWATPRVPHGLSDLEQMSTLCPQKNEKFIKHIGFVYLVKRMATSWCSGWSWSGELTFLCHTQKLSRVLSALVETLKEWPFYKKGVV